MRFTHQQSAVRRVASRLRRKRPAPQRAANRRVDATYVGRAVPAMDVTPVSSNGSRIFDADGRSYIDFYVGWCVGNLGWGEREIKARLRAFRGPDYVVPHFQYEPWGRLARMLKEAAPGKLHTSYRTVGGTESVEVALQAAMLYTGRHKFVSVEGSYHGNSITALSVGGSENREGFDRMFPGCSKVTPPLDEAALSRVETRLKGGDVAGFIMEPVSCNLGPLIPDPRFMVGLQKLCKEYGTLLIMDEVACGFGRTGTLFATEHYDIQPDVLCMAKAITGGYAPMGATLMTKEVSEEIAHDLDFYSTFGWHPLAVEAAIGNLEFFNANRQEIFRNIRDRNLQFTRRLQAMDLGSKAELTSIGMTFGVKLDTSDRTHRIVERCRRNGLLLTEEDRTLQMFPALNLDEGTADEGLDILEQIAARYVR